MLGLIRRKKWISWVKPGANRRPRTRPTEKADTSNAAFWIIQFWENKSAISPPWNFYLGNSRKEAISMASSSYSRLSPPEVPMELHVTNRKKLLDSLCHHLSLSSRPLHGYVFLQVNSLSLFESKNWFFLFDSDSFIQSGIVVFREETSKHAMTLITSNSSGNHSYFQFPRLFFLAAVILVLQFDLCFKQKCEFVYFFWLYFITKNVWRKYFGRYSVRTIILCFAFIKLFFWQLWIGIVTVLIRNINVIFRWMFRQESYFAYLFGVREPGFYGAIVSWFLLCWFPRQGWSFFLSMHIILDNMYSFFFSFSFFGEVLMLSSLIVDYVGIIYRNIYFHIESNQN